MTSSIPNGFSSSDLEAMFDAAPKEAELQAKPETEMTDIERIDAAADEALNSVENPGPVVHKVMAMKVISRMIEWHTNYGQAMIAEGESDAGVAWLRDAGKFQAVMCILQGINVGEDDFSF